MTAVSPTTTPVPWSMQNERPIEAPGWMSMPVRVWATSARSRGRIGHAEVVDRVGDPVDGDGQEARVRRDHLVDGFGGRVAGTDRLGVEDEAGVDLRQRLREGVDDARRVRLPGERCDETAQVAAGEDQAGGELVRARGGVIGELREEDAEEPSANAATSRLSG